MLLALPVLLQAAAIDETITFDLKQVQGEQSCGARSSEGEIVVCARPDGRDPRLEPSSREASRIPGPGLGFRLGQSARVNMFAEGGALANGFVSNRAMVSLTVPF